MAFLNRNNKQILNLLQIWAFKKSNKKLENLSLKEFLTNPFNFFTKKEILGVTSSRLMRLTPEGETLKSWRFNTMKYWNVNWDIKQFEIKFDDEDLTFLCVNCDAKILHEFIGGYIFLSLRSTDKSDSCSDEMFFKLIEKKWIFFCYIFKFPIIYLFISVCLL